MEPTEIANARAAYNAYNAGGDPATANKNFRGEPCPEWDDLPQNIRDKWIAATAPASETLDNACLWRDDALAEWRKSYPCPRGCGTMGQCVDPATMSPAICPVCYNETPAQDALDKARKLPACLTVDDLQRESYETAVAKGWHDEDGKTLSGAVIHIAKQSVGVLDVAATVEGIRAGKAPIYSHPEHVLERLDALPPERLRAVAWMVLVVTEVGESVEDILNEHMTTDVNLAGKPTGLGSELADIIIRVCDTAGALGIDLAAELRSKLDYNRTRSHRHGGKLA